MSVLIKGGRIVTAADDYVGDIFIEDERVSLIGESLDMQADKVIDASGKYVIPGAIDPHTHMEMPFGGTVSCDDFTSGTISAAFGGSTSHRSEERRVGKEGRPRQSVERMRRERK